MPKNDSLTIEQFMFDKLFDPKYGFYETQKITDHFITPSTISSSYHTYLRDWLIKQNFAHILEIGAGTGALAKEVAAHFPSYSILEKSSYQINLQKESLSAESQKHVQWIASIPNEFDGMILMQEVFDCLPACMYGFEKGRILWEWCIRGNKLEQVPVQRNLSPIFQEYLDAYQDFHRDMSAVVDITPANQLLEQIYKNIQIGTKILIIDYGSTWRQNRGQSCPLRGYQYHNLQSHPWECEGPQDLTYSVDFSGLAWAWERMGGAVHWTFPLAHFLIDALEWHRIDPFTPDRMLFDPRIMGHSFMAMLLEKTPV